jgi:hypothetical protein
LTALSSAASTRRPERSIEVRAAAGASWRGPRNRPVRQRQEIDGDARAQQAVGAAVADVKNGPLVIDSNSEVTGEGVGFYFTGDDAVFSFKSNAMVELSAPETGPLAGLLFFQDPATPAERAFEITSDFVDYLVGTIYLPQGRLTIDSNHAVAEASEYTVLVVRRLELRAGPKLVLNTGYALSDVPVPEGVGPTTTGGGVRLTH